MILPLARGQRRFLKGWFHADGVSAAAGNLYELSAPMVLSYTYWLLGCVEAHHMHGAGVLTFGNGNTLFGGLCFSIVEFPNCAVQGVSAICHSN